MTRSRFAALALASSALAALGLCGCGGGIGSGIEPIYLEYGLEGEVSSRDGAQEDLSGIVVTCLETGETAVTDAGGRFRLLLESDGAVLPQVTLQFLDPGRSAPPSGATDPSEASDVDPDALDIHADEVLLAVPPAGPGTGAALRMTVSLTDGAVTQAAVEAVGEPSERAPRTGEETLVRAQSKIEDAYAGGEVEVEVAGACSSLEVEIDKVMSTKAALEVRLTSPGGGEVSLGPVVVDANGQGHFAMKSCGGDPLPFGAASIDDFAGWPLSVVDASGAALFTGRVPVAGVDTDA